MQQKHEDVIIVTDKRRQLFLLASQRWVAAFSPTVYAARIAQQSAHIGFRTASAAGNSGVLASKVDIHRRLSCRSPGGLDRSPLLPNWLQIVLVKHNEQATRAKEGDRGCAIPFTRILHGRSEPHAAAVPEQRDKPAGWKQYVGTRNPTTATPAHSCTSVAAVCEIESVVLLTSRQLQHHDQTPARRKHQITASLSLAEETDLVHVLLKVIMAQWILVIFLPFVSTNGIKGDMWLSFVRNERPSRDVYKDVLQCVQIQDKVSRYLHSDTSTAIFITRDYDVTGHHPIHIGGSIFHITILENMDELTDLEKNIKASLKKHSTLIWVVREMNHTGSSKTECISSAPKDVLKEWANRKDIKLRVTNVQKCSTISQIIEYVPEQFADINWDSRQKGSKISENHLK
ncbi:Protein of unknown function [Gryllus bimaculatus]|nr:Protein of unknown function [Gryllus bimaculatus]